MLDLRETIVRSLTDLASAREYLMAYPETAKPIYQPSCETCGGTMRNHPAWITLTVRCGSSWHNAVRGA